MEKVWEESCDMSISLVRRSLSISSTWDMFSTGKETEGKGRNEDNERGQGGRGQGRARTVGGDELENRIKLGGVSWKKEKEKKKPKGEE
jgi:hypothetical protein